ncbi:hypothetical protein [Viridibacillus arvi]|uniref:hypothetical protein n=1 Tax=Viridibacillus arvi TaxID=263475 RepID=UPI0034CF4C6B
MNIERGDSIKFGEQWCNKHGSEELSGKTIKLTPQYFEEDNGLYVNYSECPGIYDKENEEAESIYHLFGNHFENFMDCKLIKGTDADKEEYEKIIKDQREVEAKSWG